MRVVLTVVCLFALGPFTVARKPAFTPTEGQFSEHRAEVYRIAREYVVESFNLVPIEESQFNPVRFNSSGVWGDFETRVKDLGDHRFEVRGWMVPEGHEGARKIWSVVVRYELFDPEGWMYRRIDEPFSNDPEISSWRFGDFRSAPYEAEYVENFVP
jgi:hypothetical protein